MPARPCRYPDGRTVTFGYDALGRRVSKRTGNSVHRFGWDGNVVLHEWDIEEADRPKLVTDETGREEYDGTEKPDNLVTWVYDGTSFTPVAKVTDGERYTIVHDYLGTPTQAYDSKGELVWEMLLDVYGKVMECHGDRALVPFRYQGQYEDEETGLYYNRFRYYDPKTGNYISQDPIGLASGNPTLYGHVFDPNTQIDLLGLDVIDDAWKVVQSHINNSGTTVLGHFPRTGEAFESYIEKAQRVGASYFDMGSLWDKVKATGKDPWELNKKFLDKIISKGDKVLLNVPKNKIRPGSYLEQEIRHLQKNGYKWVNQWSLKKSCH